MSVSEKNAKDASASSNARIEHPAEAGDHGYRRNGWAGLRCGTPVKTAVHVITTGVLIALLTGIAMKLRWFGPSP